MKRTPLRRYARLEAHKPMRNRRAHPRDRGEFSDPDYLAWLRKQPCRVPGCSGPSEAHHLRHDERGASLGGHVKDDRRSISLCHGHHIFERHGNAGYFTGWLRGDIQAWEDRQLAEQRSGYLRQCGEGYQAMAF